MGKLTESDLITMKSAKWWGGEYCYLDNSFEVGEFARDVQRDALSSVLGRIRLMEEHRKALGCYNEEHDRGYGEIIEEWISKL